MELRDSIGRRGLLAIGVVAASVAPAAGCFSLKADDTVSGADAAEGSTEDSAVVSDAADVQGDAAPDEAALEAGNASDFYVGISPPEGGTTYSTIHAALDAANVSSAPTRTIHVGPGTYSTGESFPIILRGGVSLIGSGATTVLSGTGPAAISPPGASQAIATTDVKATIVVGDSAKATTIAHLVISGTARPAPGSEGIACDRGVTTAPGPTTPNTFIDDITIDGLEIAVNVTTSLPPPSRSGCAGRITRSMLKNGSYGVVVGGSVSAYDGTPLQLVSAEIGDGTSDAGNVFQRLQDNPGSVGNGAGIMLGDAVTGVRVIGNRFSASDHGIWIQPYASSDTASGVDIEQNDFGPMYNTGLLISGPALVEKLVATTIHDVSTPLVGVDFLGCGLILQTNGTPAMPTVLRARGNSFIGNDLGVLVRSNVDNPVNPVVDFGTASDNGGNVFRCNSSAIARHTGDGGDVVIQLPAVAPGLVLPFEGNVWDHAPPHVDPAGNDVSAPRTVTVNVAAASSATSPACPSGHAPGM